MIICNNNYGRLGNSIFRLFANIIFCIVYNTNAHITNDIIINPDIIICDKLFANIINIIINNHIHGCSTELPNLSLYNRNNCIVLFNGYYQHDTIYKIYKRQIIDYIINHPELILKTDRNEKYRAFDLINFKPDRIYNIVVHFRLEDFIHNGLVMNPYSVKQILDRIIIEFPNETLCFVVNICKTELEQKYMDFFIKCFKNVKIESNDVITDFAIMKNAKVLVCSCSTLSWVASFLSDTVVKVYMPNYNNPDRIIHETFKNPIDNTILYDFESCTQKTLLTILELDKS